MRIVEEVDAVGSADRDPVGRSPVAIPIQTMIIPTARITPTSEVMIRWRRMNPIPSVAPSPYSSGVVLRLATNRCGGTKYNAGRVACARFGVPEWPVGEMSVVT
jgi:hypothetical protein